jgi:hypothetical protein
MEENDEIQKKLKAIGESFMKQFDDYVESEEEIEEIQPEIKEEKKEKTPKPKKEKNPKVTIFREIQDKKHKSIENRSLDKSEKFHLTLLNLKQRVCSLRIRKEKFKKEKT